MKHYQQSLICEAPPAAVYAALTTPEGLRGWWTQDYAGLAEVGETIRFRFGATHKEMLIEGLVPGREVRWRCTGAHIAQLPRHDEWVGTRLVFRLTPQGKGQTRVDFEHFGLVPDMVCYTLCEGGWQYFLDSLKKFVETGSGTPYKLEVAAVA